MPPIDGIIIRRLPEKTASSELSFDAVFFVNSIFFTARLLFHHGNNRIKELASAFPRKSACPRIIRSSVCFALFDNILRFYWSFKIMISDCSVTVKDPVACPPVITQRKEQSSVFCAELHFIFSNSAAAYYYSVGRRG